MSAEANPQLALRPMLPGEAPMLAEIFRASIMELTQDDYEVEQLAVYAVYPHRQYLSGKVRTFVDFLADYFGSPPYWDDFG